VADAYSPAVLALNPLAFWKMNEPSGTTLSDSVINNYPLTIPSAAGVEQYAIPFLPGGAAMLDWLGGGNSYAERPNTVDLAFTSAMSFTLMGWFGSVGLPGARCTLGAKGYNNAGVESRPWYGLTIETSGKARMWLRSSAGVDYIAESFSTLSDTQYISRGPIHHIAGVFDVTGPTVSIYIDGKLENSKPAVTAAWGTNTDRFQLNALNGAGGGPWMGSVAIFDKVVTPTQIADLYEAGRAGTAWYPYQLGQVLDQQNATLTDISGDLNLILNAVRKTY